MFVGRTVPNALILISLIFEGALSLIFEGALSLIFDYTVFVCCSFALAAQSPPGITDPSQVDSTPLGG